VTDQPLNLRAFARAVSRMRLMVTVLALVGLSLGAAYALGLPPRPVARALIILPSSGTTSAGTPTLDMPTQVIIATSTPVLAAAGTAVSPPVSAETLKHEVVVSSLSQDVLQVQVSAPTQAAARKLTNAVANGYIGYVTRVGSTATTGVLTQLKQENAQLTQQILNLQDQINVVSARLATEGSSSAAGQQDASLISALRSEQEEVSLQLNNVNSEIVTAQLTNSTSTGSTQLLQSAQIVPVSKLRAIELLAIGAAAGLLVGLLIAAVRAGRDRRLRLRDELAAAIGVPVVASLDARKCSSAKDWQRLIDKYRPSTLDVWNTRRVLQRLSSPAGERSLELEVVGFADDAPSLAAGALLAKAAAEIGLETALVAGDHPSLGPLRTACSGKSGHAVSPSVVYEAHGQGPEWANVRLRVSLVAVDARKPDLTSTKATTLLIVSAGFATVEMLAGVALAASDVGLPLDGLVVVNAERNDNTTGSVIQAGKIRQSSRPGPQRSRVDFAVGQSR
jgi:capsular polysaccharide biosynthesis protein